ncbi:MAG: D-alanyl-D-alanine carboxypeptidase family protein [Armatimonadota bacterium]|nr:D-alanyl-D-alanine carboxypeptidase [bacterium]
MLYRKFGRWSEAAAIISVLLTLSGPVVGADNGTLTLRLDDGQPAQSQVQNTPGEPAGQPGKAIDVPASKSYLASKPDVKAASAVVMDARTGQMLYAKNPHTRRPNASTTKMMTAILIIEHCGMDDIMTASKNVAQTPFTSIHLMPGEQITARDLLYGMMIRSANDAAVAAAEHIGGSVSKFSVMMNKKAKEIGCTDTHFVTPNGLYNPGHYSSAYDLSLIAMYGLNKYQLFNDVVNTRKYTLDSRTMNRKDIAVFAKSKFLKDYPGADGVKSGYIKQAGYCYVGSATRDGWRLVSTVLKSDNASRDTEIIMDYAFSNYEPVDVAKASGVYTKVKVDGGAAGEVPVAPVKDLTVIVPKTGARVTTQIETASVAAPVVKGAKVGKLTAYVDGNPVQSVELRAVNDVEISFGRKALEFFKMCGIVVACLVVGGKYGTAFTKNTRRRRRRITSSLRSFNNYR